VPGLVAVGAFGAFVVEGFEEFELGVPVVGAVPELPLAASVVPVPGVAVPVGAVAAVPPLHLLVRGFQVLPLGQHSGLPP